MVEQPGTPDIETPELISPAEERKFSLTPRRVKKERAAIKRNMDEAERIGNLGVKIERTTKTAQRQKEDTEVVLRQKEVVTTLDKVVAEYLSNNPSSNAVRDIGSIKSRDEGIYAVGVIRWDPLPTYVEKIDKENERAEINEKAENDEDEEVEGKKNAVVSKAVRVVCIGLRTRGILRTAIDSIDYATEKKEELDILDKNGNRKIRKWVEWTPLIIDKKAERNFSLDQKVRQAMRFADAGNGRMFDDRIVEDGKYTGSAGIGQRTL